MKHTGKEFIANTLLLQQKKKMNKILRSSADNRMSQIQYATTNHGEILKKMKSKTFQSTM